CSMKICSSPGLITLSASGRAAMFACVICIVACNLVRCSSDLQDERSTRFLTERQILRVQRLASFALASQSVTILATGKFPVWSLYNFNYYLINFLKIIDLNA